MRLGLDERGVTELMAAVDHASGLTKLAAGLRLEPESLAGGAGAGGLLRPVGDDEAAGRVAALFGEIRAWAAEHLGLDRVPALWRALGHHPVYLEAVWRRELALMDAGAVSRVQKLCVGFALAANNSASYMVDYYALALRRRGLDEHGLLEVLAVVDYFNNLNTLADGMAIESDIKPGSTYE
jgi:alkylhydroperoxidase family enzyme